MAVIECRNLTKKYGSKTALNQINLSMEGGRIIGLAGPNGSGKTTLIKLIQRLLIPTEGEILIAGDLPGKSSKAAISYLPDREFLPEWMNLDSIMSFYETFFPDFDRNRASDLIGKLGLDPRQHLKKMSKGTKEKVQLVLCMSRRAKVYLLDEPIAGVDPAARDYIIHTIINNYDENALVLISTHLISDVEPVLDEVIFLKEGNIILHENADDLRQRTGMSIDSYFREVFRC